MYADEARKISNNQGSPKSNDEIRARYKKVFDFIEERAQFGISDVEIENDMEKWGVDGHFLVAMKSFGYGIEYKEGIDHKFYFVISW